MLLESANFASLHAMDAASRTMSDYQRIRCGASALTPSQTLNLHQLSRAWLDSALGEPFPGKTVVVSHHCPHPNSIEANYADSPANPGFASDLTDLIQRHAVDLWRHGHTHRSLDHLVGATRIVCNPRGYAKRDIPENMAFQADRVIEL